MSDRALRGRSLAVAALALALACGGGRSEPARVRSDGIEIAASVSPPALRVGANEILVELRDASGAPLDAADLEIAVTMGAMGAMPAMGGPAPVEALGRGRYRAAFPLAMGGTWQVAIRARTSQGGVAAAEGSLTVGTPGLRLEPAGIAAEPPAGASAPQPEAHPGEFRFDPARLRQVGVRSEPAQRAPLDAAIRATGRVVWDESALRDVTMRVAGFAGEVRADALGARVEKGATLFLFYGPELYAAQREYLDALRADAAARATGAPDRAAALAAAAERRLRLWGIDPSEIQAIARRGEPLEYLPVRAPISGYVVEKDVVAGSAITMGQRVYRLAPLDRVWIEAEIYEAELARVHAGMPAEVALPQVPGRRFAATVAYVYPSIQPDRRTARVRLVLANPDGVLRPDMYATVWLHEPLGERLTVPESAVLRAGDRSFVFLDLGDGRLRPQRVETGVQSEGRVEITAGLEAGQPVVVAGTFLVAGESRLRAALESW